MSRLDTRIYSLQAAGKNTKDVKFYQYNRELFFGKRFITIFVRVTSNTYFV